MAAFAGTWWFLRRLRFGTEPALFGAMLFGFSGFVLLHHHHINMVAVVAHLPWLLGAADVLIVEDARRPRRLAFAAVALILGSAFLIGFPQAVWWDAIALAAFAALRAGERGRWRRLLTAGRGGRDRRAPRRHPDPAVGGRGRALGSARPTSATSRSPIRCTR